MSGVEEMKAHWTSVLMRDGAERASDVTTPQMYAWCAIAHSIITQVKFIRQNVFITKVRC